MRLVIAAASLFASVALAQDAPQGPAVQQGPANAAVKSMRQRAAR